METMRYNPDIPGTDLRSDTPYIISERTQAQWLARAWLAGLSVGVAKMFYFLDLETDTWSNATAYLRDEGIKPVVCVINTMCTMLGSATYVSKTTYSNNDVYLMFFQSGGTAIAAVWSRNDDNYTISVPAGTGGIQATDIMGNPMSLASSQGMLQVPVNGYPLFDYLDAVVGKPACRGALDQPAGCQQWNDRGHPVAKLNAPAARTLHVKLCSGRFAIWPVKNNPGISDARNNAVIRMEPTECLERR